MSALTNNFPKHPMLVMKLAESASRMRSFAQSTLSSHLVVLQKTFPTDIPSKFVVFPSRLSACFAWLHKNLSRIMRFAKTLTSFGFSTDSANGGSFRMSHWKKSWMKEIVISFICKLKILQTVIRFITIFVMNNFSVCQRPAKIIGHHKSLLHDISVSHCVWMTIRLNINIPRLDLYPSSSPVCLAFWMVFFPFYPTSSTSSVCLGSISPATNSTVYANVS